MGEPERFKRVSDLRALRVHRPSTGDLERVRALSPSDCPRRYCWWWRSLAFEWESAPAEGCRYLADRRESQPALPCQRSNSSSSLDHFEPREPHLIEDGVDETHFTGVPDPGTRASIRRVLVDSWHPLRPDRDSRSLAEYDLYVGALYGFLRARSQPLQIARWLWGFHSNSRSWSTEDPSPLLGLAEELLAIPLGPAT